MLFFFLSSWNFMRCSSEIKCLRASVPTWNISTYFWQITGTEDNWQVICTTDLQENTATIQTSFLTHLTWSESITDNQHTYVKIHRSVGDEQVAVFLLDRYDSTEYPPCFFLFVYAERLYALSAVIAFIQQCSAICLFDAFSFQLVPPYGGEWWFKYAGQKHWIVIGPKWNLIFVFGDIG